VVAGLGPDLVTVKKATRAATGRKEVPDMALEKEEKKRGMGKEVLSLGKKKKGKKEKEEGQVTGREREREEKKGKKGRERNVDFETGRIFCGLIMWSIV
jgi:hypothetical protein